MKKFTVILMLFLMSGCASLPKGVTAVSGFDVDRYVGKWYEIARLDHSFERGLSNVTAEYIAQQDGSLKIINRGYNTNKNKWQEAKGKAKFIDAKTLGRLKVSFFGPFYGGYNIIALDKQNYEYVMIVGNNRKNLWILSRKPTLNPNLKERLIAQAKSINFPTEDLIYVDHSLVNTQ